MAAAPPTILDAKWQLFVKIAQAGSVTGAAVALDMPASVVSRTLAQLEADVGARLFRRTGRGVVLTEFGEQVRPRIEALIRDAAQLADEMRTRSGLPMGDVRFGLLPSTVAVLAGPLFSEVRRQWPEVRLHLTEGASAQLEEWLGQGRLDMATLLREDGAPGTGDEPVLARLPLNLVMPRGDALAGRKSIRFDELAGLPLVLPSEPHPLRGRLAVLARERGLRLEPALEADSIRLQHQLVASGGGFAITAGTLDGPQARQLVAVRIARPTLTRSVVLGVTAQRPHTLATRSVAALARSLAPGLLRLHG
ncbi:MAG: LysR family transcriptional regulator [Variovorax paradoxus]|uniref:LysR family transcriptional regulator n=1 Tax=Variovorax paradoxus TaxID=34073 RepID=A0A2W5SU04_VARPD|nr:MAG: LysR family transcriptional regulator [Variovorax paradoxus]